MSKDAKHEVLNLQEMLMTDECNPIQILLTDREKETIVPGKSKTLHRPSVVGDGIMTSFILDVPNADEAPATVTAAGC